MVVLRETLAVLRDLVAAILRLLFGRRKAHHVDTIMIEAPPHVVWDVVTSHNATFGGFIPVDITSERIEGVPGGIVQRQTIAGTTAVLGLQEIERDEGRAILWKVLPEHTDRRAIHGRDHYMAWEIRPHTGGVELKAAQRLHPNNIITDTASRWSQRFMLRKVKAHVEGWTSRG